MWGWIHIVPCADGDGLERKFFRGQFNAESSDDVHAMRMIGLAGTCAERIDTDEHASAAHILDLIRDEVIHLSETDAAMAGEFDDSHLEECLSILRSQWSSIVGDTLRQIELETRTAERENRAMDTTRR